MTIKEIADLAGVSPAAVSLVLNNKPGVGAAKRAEIQSLLIRHYHVSPDTFETEKTRQVLFLKYSKTGYIAEENSNFISAILDEIEVECRKRHDMLRIEVCRNTLEDSLQNIDYASLDGMIVLGSEIDESMYPLLTSIPIPYVVIDNRMPLLHCNAVTMNNHEMVYDAVAHLASLGSTEIGYLQSAMPAQNFKDRAEAFFAACRDLHLTCRPESVYSLVPNLMDACSGMKTYLSEGAVPPRCLFADNDTLAIGAMKALQQFGYLIPEDIFIVGFDDIRFASIHSPSLSTMRVPKALIGRLAVESLHAAMTDPSADYCKHFVSGELIVRHSTSPD